MSGQCCSDKGDGGLAMGSRPLTSCLLVVLYTLQSFGTCPTWSLDLGSDHFSPHSEMTRPRVLKMPGLLISFHRFCFEKFNKLSGNFWGGALT